MPGEQWSKQLARNKCVTQPHLTDAWEPPGQLPLHTCLACTYFGPFFSLTTFFSCRVSPYLALLPGLVDILHEWGLVPNTAKSRTFSNLPVPACRALPKA